MEGAAAAGDADRIDPDAAAVLLDDSLRDVEAEAEAAVADAVGSLEALEDVALLVRRDADTMRRTSPPSGE